MTVSKNSAVDQPQSIFDPGRNCTVVAHANRVATLVDADDYFKTFARAAERATESIIILAWDLDSRTRLHHEESGLSTPPLLGDFLNFLVKRRRGLHIHVLNWDYPMVFGTNRETRPLYGLGWKPKRRVKLRYDNTHPVGGSQHQKIVVMDDAMAFCGGIDLTCRRWDTCKHQPEDERRTVSGAPYPPFHDVMTAVDGDLAIALGRIARTRWLNATGRHLAACRNGADVWPADLKPHMTDVTAAVSRTMPEIEGRGEIREVEALYLDMIAAARRYIYLENQYFTSDKLGTALASRLSEADPPEIVVVTRLLSHGWLEEHTMEVLRTRLIKQLRAVDKKTRFGIYYPRVPGLMEGTCVDIHSKIAVVDDEWLRIGSANFANRSMGLDSECDVTFEAAADAQRRGAIRDFRDTLLSEHLDVPLPRLQAALDKTGSLHAAIRELHCERRTLKAFDELPESSNAVMILASVADPERPVSLDQLIDQFSPETGNGHARPAWVKVSAIVAVFAALALAWRYTPLADLITAERIISWARTVGDTAWAPIAVAFAFSPAAFVMFPRPLITLFAVIAFGPWLGFAISIAGIAGSAVCVYYAGRAVPRDRVRRLAGKRLNRISELLRNRGLVAAFACSIAPVAPFVVVGMVAGAVRIRLWQYVVGTLLGMLPGTLATTVFGRELAAALEDPSKINYWIVAGIVVVLAALLYGAKRWMTELENGKAAKGPRRLPAVGAAPAV